MTRIDALIDDKTENITNTADVVIDPIWDNINNPDYLNVYLGNNGRLALELPGALAISKDARVAANKNLNADEILKDKKFTFEISIPSMKEKQSKRKYEMRKMKFREKHLNWNLIRPELPSIRLKMTKRCIFMDWIKMRNIP